ncbi:hypothetical protein ACTFOJ_02560 [Bacillus cereus group sp. MYBK77-1]|uniref:hypothetical protein n=1 Tax=Bacillus cereus group TaxID=86661 RepID=UPI00016B8A2D|nr:MULTISPECIES: hypothetical protein [Bacillus cereus group]EDZ59255.1 conserved hypothetical protein [Bacillus cereus H3081.97]KLA02954.1 hypothetical protein B4086_2496 [Bacillus cereus]KXI72282.1 hypothetical protein ACS51_01800 [Bacillus cereus]MCC2432192.1 hypothetical protein [Bacillus paranthracis]MDX5915491.1 hypothetical protein [Bacillus cereus group sp. BfR-BA-01026]
MEKVFPNYKHYLKNWRFIFIFILPTIAFLFAFDVIFELIFHQDFYLSNLIFAIILFLIFMSIKDMFKIKS